ncbi:hypothetical protein Sjap_008852 [Stephania japonica]|uniref:Protein arginine methyltransferase NDUFAF7 n=1 Tax=Stephania japonica TaxID=461633 RepID=A0AAP0JRX3_9MAGN
MVYRCSTITRATQLHLLFFGSQSLTRLSACPHSAFFSTTSFVGDTPVLVRDYIRSALYHPDHGYFSQRSGSVGMLERSIKFNQLEGRKAYMQYVNKLYKQNDISWFTPVELFKPWYAHGIAEAILRTANLSVPLKVLSGNYLPNSVSSVEISSSLAKKQIETVGEVRSHMSRYRVECRDAADKSGWGEVDPNPCWVIMLEGRVTAPDGCGGASAKALTEAEVLDNLPHDLIYSANQVSQWLEVWLEKNNNSQHISEVYKPIQDPLIAHCVEIIDMDKQHKSMGKGLTSVARNIWSKVFPKPQRSWVPTGCMKDGHSSDHKSYLDAKGDADIFFPTDFWLLERIDHYCSGWLNLQGDTSCKQGKKRRTIILGTDQFMEEFGLPSKTRTKDGYNPLLDDFKNTKFYLSVPTHNIQ